MTHDGMVVRLRQSRWRWWSAVTAAVAGVGGPLSVLFVIGPVVFTSGISLPLVVVPMLMSVAVVLSLLRWGKPPLAHEWRGVGSAALALTASAMLWLSWVASVEFALMAVPIGLAMLLAAAHFSVAAQHAWLVHTIEASNDMLRLRWELGAEEIPLQRVASLEVGKRDLQVRLTDGAELVFEHAMAGKELEELQRLVLDAAARARESGYEQTPPPDELVLLSRRAQAQVVQDPATVPKR